MAGLEWWDTTGATKYAPNGTGLPTFTGVIGGTPSAAKTARLWNNKGGVGAQDKEGLSISALARAVSSDPFEAEDIEYLERAYVQFRLSGSSAWIDALPGVELDIPTISNDEYQDVEFRINAPDDNGASSFEILIRLHDNSVTALGRGFFEGIGNGVISRIGDSSANQILSFTGISEDPGGASDSVYVQKLLALSAGVIVAKDELVLVGTDDDNGDTPAAGEKFYAGITISEGVLNVHLGIKDTAPLSDADKPTIPDGERLLGWVTQDDTGNIENADIDNEFYLDRFGYTYAALNFTVHHGEGLVDNNIAYHKKLTVLALTNNATNWVFFNRDRTLNYNTTGELPENRSMLLWKVITAAGAITKVIDCRPIVGAKVSQIQIQSGGTAADKGYAAYHGNSAGYITQVRSSHLPVGALGGDETIVDINTSSDGTTFTTIFTEQDYRPSIDDAALDTVLGFPIVRTLTPGDIIEQEIDADTTTPADLVITTLTIESA